jgi:hypothetical protein
MGFIEEALVSAQPPGIFERPRRGRPNTPESAQTVARHPIRHPLTSVGAIIFLSERLYGSHGGEAAFDKIAQRFYFNCLPI